VSLKSILHPFAVRDTWMPGMPLGMDRSRYNRLAGRLEDQHLDDSVDARLGMVLAAVASHILAVGSDRSVFPPGEELEIVGFVPCATMTNDNGANCSRPRRCSSFTSSLSTLAQPIARGRVSALPK
jgi:hypothetical protein